MPTYVYRCLKEGHTFEAVQGIKEPPIKECSVCGGEVQRVIFAPTVLTKRDLLERTDRGEFDWKKKAEGEKEFGGEDIDDFED